MSLENSTSKVIYQGNGSTKVFSFAFKVWEPSQVRVMLAEGDSGTETDVTAQVAVSMSATGGTVTFSTAPAAGTTLAILRSMPFVQEDRYITGTRFDPHEIEEALDIACAERQELKEQLGRAVKLPSTDTRTPEEYAQELLEGKYEAQRWAEYAEKQADRTVQIPSETEVLADGSTTPRALQDRFADVINVKDFGAVGDGVADDTAAIQAALDAAGKRGGGIVFIPHGVYGITANMAIYYDNVHVIGDDATLYRLQSSASLFLRLRVNPDTDTPHDDVYFGRKNILIEGIKFLLRGDVFTDRGTEAITMGFADGVTVRRCTFVNRRGAHTIEVSGCANVLIEDCRFLGAWENADDVHSAREHIQLEYSTGGVEGKDSGYFTNTRNVTIRGCYFGASDEMQAAHGCIGAHNAIEHRFSAEHVLVENCTFDGVLGPSISFYTSYDYQVRNNVFKNCYQPLYISCTRAMYDRHGNTLDGSKAPEKLIFTGNYVETGLNANSSGYLVYTRTDDDEENIRIKDVIISDNIFVANGDDGHLALRFLDGALISNNIFKGDVNGIASINHSQNWTFSGNRCSGYKANGIFTIESSFSSGLSFGISITNNTFEANQAATAGRTVYIMGASAHYIDDVHISGNIFTGDYAGANNPPIHIAYIDRVSVFSNTFNLINLASGKSCIGGTGYCNNCAIGVNSRLPMPNNSGELLYNVSGRSKTERAFQGDTLFVGSKNKGAAISIANTTPSGNFLSIAAETPAGTPNGKLCFGIASNDRTLVEPVLECGIDSGSAGYYVRPSMKDNSVSCGSASWRWNQIFAASDTINTSDAREKTSVASPDEALMRAWGRVDFKAFQFTDAVEKKGEEARIHFGVIAQQVAEAFASEGLDAFRYALFCYDKWDDEYEDVEVVDVEAVLDEQGNEVTPAVTHTEKRLVTPAGDRYGIRYSEALALECAYQRWRLDKLEAKLNG